MAGEGQSNSTSASYDFARAYDARNEALKLKGNYASANAAGTYDLNKTYVWVDSSLRPTANSKSDKVTGYVVSGKEASILQEKYSRIRQAQDNKDLNALHIASHEYDSFVSRLKDSKETRIIPDAEGVFSGKAYDPSAIRWSERPKEAEYNNKGIFGWIGGLINRKNPEARESMREASSDLTVQRTVAELQNDYEAGKKNVPPEFKKAMDDYNAGKHPLQAQIEKSAESYAHPEAPQEKLNSPQIKPETNISIKANNDSDLESEEHLNERMRAIFGNDRGDGWKEYRRQAWQNNVSHKESDSADSTGYRVAQKLGPQEVELGRHLKSLNKTYANDDLEARMNAALGPENTSQESAKDYNQTLRDTNLAFKSSDVHKPKPSDVEGGYGRLGAIDERHVATEIKEAMKEHAEEVKTAQSYTPDKRTESGDYLITPNNLLPAAQLEILDSTEAGAKRVLESYRSTVGSQKTQAEAGITAGDVLAGYNKRDNEFLNKANEQARTQGITPGDTLAGYKNRGDEFLNKIDEQNARSPEITAGDTLNGYNSRDNAFLQEAERQRAISGNVTPGDSLAGYKNRNADEFLNKWNEQGSRSPGVTAGDSLRGYASRNDQFLKQFDEQNARSPGVTAGDSLAGYNKRVQPEKPDEFLNKWDEQTARTQGVTPGDTLAGYKKRSDEFVNEANRQAARTGGITPGDTLAGYNTRDNAFLQESDRQRAISGNITPGDTLAGYKNRETDEFLNKAKEQNIGGISRGDVLAGYKNRNADEFLNKADEEAKRTQGTTPGDTFAGYKNRNDEFLNKWDEQNAKSPGVSAGDTLKDYNRRVAGEKPDEFIQKWDAQQANYKGIQPGDTLKGYASRDDQFLKQLNEQNARTQGIAPGDTLAGYKNRGDEFVNEANKQSATTPGVSPGDTLAGYNKRVAGEKPDEFLRQADEQNVGGISRGDVLVGYKNRQDEFLNKWNEQNARTQGISPGDTLRNYNARQPEIEPKPTNGAGPTTGTYVPPPGATPGAEDYASLIQKVSSYRNEKAKLQPADAEAAEAELLNKYKLSEEDVQFGNFAEMLEGLYKVKKAQAKTGYPASGGLDDQIKHYESILREDFGERSKGYLAALRRSGDEERAKDEYLSDEGKAAIEKAKTDWGDSVENLKRVSAGIYDVEDKASGKVVTETVSSAAYYKKNPALSGNFPNIISDSDRKRAENLINARELGTGNREIWEKFKSDRDGHFAEDYRKANGLIEKAQASNRDADWDAFNKFAGDLSRRVQDMAQKEYGISERLADYYQTSDKRAEDARKEAEARKNATTSAPSGVTA